MAWWMVCNLILAVGIFFMMIYSDLRDARIEYQRTGDPSAIRGEVVWWTFLIILCS